MALSNVIADGKSTSGNGTWVQIGRHVEKSNTNSYIVSVDGTFGSAEVDVVVSEDKSTSLVAGDVADGITQNTAIIVTIPDGWWININVVGTPTSINSEVAPYVV